MRETILYKLNELEKKENVRILLAVESGSRAWGFASPDSDYDVRFIYVRPKAEYLRLEKTRDVIELPIEGALDINGWDLDKTLRLLHGSNPTLFEWFSSPIVYRETPFAEEFRAVMQKYFCSKRDSLTTSAWPPATAMSSLRAIQSRPRSTFMCSVPFWPADGSWKKGRRRPCSSPS